MRFRLIYPRPPTTNDAVYSPSRAIDLFFATADKFLGGGIYEAGKRQFLVPPLNLLLLAALVPDDVEVDIVDERTGAIDFDESVDLVGITAMTADAPRAYEICDEYSARGVPTVLGGIHPTVMPGEASSFATSVVVGEAEYVLDELIADARRGRLKPRYEAEQFHDLRGLPHPRQELLDPRHYITTNVLQTTRGCPHRCSFCSISTTAGLKFRTRPVDEVVAEVSRARGRFIAIVDDNVNGHPGYARELFSGLRDLDVHWYGDTTIFIAEDENLLKLMAASGCKIALIGFESLSQSTLNSINKRFNKVNRYHEMIRRIHDHGIGVIGSFILGLDGDGVRQIDELVEFAERSSLDLVQVSVLTPYPGTELFDRFESEGRILTKKWEEYDTTQGNVVFEPIALSPADLRSCYFEAYRRIYSWKGILRRTAGSRSYPTFFVPYNLRQRKKVRAAMNARAERRRITEVLAH